MSGRSGKLQVVAFLQNMWVRDPERMKRAFAEDTTGKLRLRMIEYCLFAGCLTGRRLKAAFGDWCEDIIWEEASPVISGDPKEYHAADPLHIASVLHEHKPQVVLCFTRAGEKVIRAACGDGVHFIPVVHPACRGIGTVGQLKDAARQLTLAYQFEK